MATRCYDSVALIVNFTVLGDHGYTQVHLLFELLPH